MNNLAEIYVNNRAAAILEQHENGRFSLRYYANYSGAPISLTLPINQKNYEFESFPPFFEGA